MTASVYNHEIRVMFYENFLKEGAFYTKPGAKGYVFLGMSRDEFHNVLQNVYDRLISENVFESRGYKNPKSFKAFGPQLQFGIGTSAKDNKKIKNQNRLAAYEAGWMTMTDIIELEKIESVRSIIEA